MPRARRKPDVATSDYQEIARRWHAPWSGSLLAMTYLILRHTKQAGENRLLRV
jgi:hypothetical protein